MSRKEQNAIINEYHLNRHQPDKPQFVVHDLNAYLAANQGKANKAHIHSFYQLIWFKKGTGTHFVDFKAHDVGDNAVFLIARNQVHCFDTNPEYEGVLIHFSELFLGQSESRIDFLVKCSLFNNPYHNPSCFIGAELVTILDEYVQQIRRELATEDTVTKNELLCAYLKAFLIQVQRRKNELEQGSSKTPVLLDEKKEQLVRFVNLVDEHFNKGFAVAEYARQLGISPRTLSELTARALNKTPLTMIRERVILEAQRLLVHSALNVNQIGYRLGFDDPSYFVKYFKKHSRLAPSEFRKSIS